MPGQKRRYNVRFPPVSIDFYSDTLKPLNALIKKKKNKLTVSCARVAWGTCCFQGLSEIWTLTVLSEWWAVRLWFSVTTVLNFVKRKLSYQFMVNLEVYIDDRRRSIELLDRWDKSDSCLLKDTKVKLTCIYLFSVLKYWIFFDMFVFYIILCKHIQ